MEQLVRKIAKELKTKISDRYELREMRIFGSSARGDRREYSDIDIFVCLFQVNRQIEETLFDIAYELELKYDCLIDLIVLSDEVTKKKYNVLPIYQKILSEGITV
ncbi:MAG: nucleotidyltransferase domain-containing protein [bacterium]|nr:nucleotidyltransferase domain-containing protein [bacterium]